MVVTRGGFGHRGRPETGTLPLVPQSVGAGTG